MEPESRVFPWSHVEPLRPGTHALGRIAWPETVLSAHRWPYHAFHGTAPGKAVLITAAVHGGEYVGTLAALELARSLYPADVRGSLMILPVVNPSAFWERISFLTPEDGQNQNRSFPGRHNGTYTERVAYRLVRDIIAQADVVIDLHGGDIPEALVTYVASYSRGEREFDQRARAILECFGAPYASLTPAPGVARTLTATAHALGKLTLLVECGDRGMARQEDIALVGRGLRNVLRHLGVLSTEVTPLESPQWIEMVTQQLAEDDCLWQSAVTLGQMVSEGEIVGMVTDLMSGTRREIVAEVDGFVMSYSAALPVRKGEQLLTIGRYLDGPSVGA